MIRNLHKAYYKDYFDGLDFTYIALGGQAPDGVKDEIKSRNAALCAGGQLCVIPAVEDLKPEHSFQMQVLYPGLVTGIGIRHETKIEGEFKLGVHFDWTYGMPVIYGSSVKGVLKSAFKDGYVDNSLIANANEGISEMAKVPAWVADEANKKAIINRIFEGKDSNDKNISIYERDIFFDAVISRADRKGRILCSDSITPHGDNPLKNPVPITFIKIAPGCTVEFRFKLRDSDFGGGKKLTAGQKKTLFERILTTVGIGAKTNIGYGQFK